MNNKAGKKGNINTSSLVIYNIIIKNIILSTVQCKSYKNTMVLETVNKIITYKYYK